MKLHKHTVSPALWNALLVLMEMEPLQYFRLVGGTSLSLIMGHRVSVDIDMFTDAEYGSIDFSRVEEKLIQEFPFVELGFRGETGPGQSYYVGYQAAEMIKLDLFYTDKFIRPVMLHGNLRLSNVEDIIAMKLEVVAYAGRKKDFWDLHELLNEFTLSEMIGFYLERYPYGASKAELLEKMIDFGNADDDFDPKCLRQKYWELIKLDIEMTVKSIKADY